MYHNLYIYNLEDSDSLIYQDNIQMKLPTSDGKQLNSRLIERGS